MRISCICYGIYYTIFPFCKVHLSPPSKAAEANLPSEGVPNLHIPDDISREIETERDMLHLQFPREQYPQHRGTIDRIIEESKEKLSGDVSSFREVLDICEKMNGLDALKNADPELRLAIDAARRSLLSKVAKKFRKKESIDGTHAMRSDVADELWENIPVPLEDLEMFQKRPRLLNVYLDHLIEYFDREIKDRGKEFVQQFENTSTKLLRDREQFVKTFWKAKKVATWKDCKEFLTRCISYDEKRTARCQQMGLRRPCIQARQLISQEDSKYMMDITERYFRDLAASREKGEVSRKPPLCVSRDDFLAMVESTAPKRILPNVENKDPSAEQSDGLEAMDCDAIVELARLAIRLPHDLQYRACVAYIEKFAGIRRSLEERVAASGHSIVQEEAWATCEERMKADLDEKFLQLTSHAELTSAEFLERCKETGAAHGVPEQIAAQWKQAIVAVGGEPMSNRGRLKAELMQKWRGAFGSALNYVAAQKFLRDCHGIHVRDREDLRALGVTYPPGFVEAQNASYESHATAFDAIYAQAAERKKKLEAPKKADMPVDAARELLVNILQVHMKGESWDKLAAEMGPTKDRYSTVIHACVGGMTLTGFDKQGHRSTIADKSVLLCMEEQWHEIRQCALRQLEPLIPDGEARSLHEQCMRHLDEGWEEFARQADAQCSAPWIREWMEERRSMPRERPRPASISLPLFEYFFRQAEGTYTANGFFFDFKQSAYGTLLPLLSALDKGKLRRFATITHAWEGDTAGKIGVEYFRSFFEQDALPSASSVVNFFTLWRERRATLYADLRAVHGGIARMVQERFDAFEEFVLRRICEELDLPGMPELMAQRATEKVRQEAGRERERLRKLARKPIPRDRCLVLVRETDDARSKVQELLFPQPASPQKAQDAIECILTSAMSAWASKETMLPAHTDIADVRDRTMRMVLQFKKGLRETVARVFARILRPTIMDIQNAVTEYFLELDDAHAAAVLALPHDLQDSFPYTVIDGIIRELESIGSLADLEGRKGKSSATAREILQMVHRAIRRSVPVPPAPTLQPPVLSPPVLPSAPPSAPPSEAPPPTPTPSSPLPTPAPPPPEPAPPGSVIIPTPPEIPSPQSQEPEPRVQDEPRLPPRHVILTEGGPPAEPPEHLDRERVLARVTFGAARGVIESVMEQVTRSLRSKTTDDGVIRVPLAHPDGRTGDAMLISNHMINLGIQEGQPGLVQLLDEEVSQALGEFAESAAIGASVTEEEFLRLIDASKESIAADIQRRINANRRLRRLMGCMYQGKKIGEEILKIDGAAVFSGDSTDAPADPLRRFAELCAPIFRTLLTGRDDAAPIAFTSHEERALRDFLRDHSRDTAVDDAMLREAARHLDEEFHAGYGYRAQNPRTLEPVIRSIIAESARQHGPSMVTAISPQEARTLRTAAGNEKIDLEELTPQMEKLQSMRRDMKSPKNKLELVSYCEAIHDYAMMYYATLKKWVEGDDTNRHYVPVAWAEYTRYLAMHSENAFAHLQDVVTDSPERNGPDVLFRAMIGDIPMPDQTFGYLMRKRSEVSLTVQDLQRRLAGLEDGGSADSTDERDRLLAKLRGEEVKEAQLQDRINRMLDEHKAAQILLDSLKEQP